MQEKDYVESNFRLSRRDHARLKEMAKKTGRKMGDIIVSAVMQRVVMFELERDKNE